MTGNAICFSVHFPLPIRDREVVLAAAEDFGLDTKINGMSAGERLTALPRQVTWGSWLGDPRRAARTYVVSSSVAYHARNVGTRG